MTWSKNLVNLSLCMPRTQWVKGGIAPAILNLSTRGEWKAARPSRCTLRRNRKVGGPQNRPGLFEGKMYIAPAGTRKAACTSVYC